MKKTLAALALAVAAVVGLAAPSSAAVFNVPLWFRSRVCVEVAPDVDPSWNVVRSVRMWRQQDSPVMLHMAHTEDGTCLAEHHIEIQQVSKPTADWLGITDADSAEQNSHRRTLVTIQLNAGPMADYSTEQRECAREWAATHELGHGLGLGHQFDVPESVMSYSSSSACGVPVDFDYRVLQNTYERHALPLG